VANRSTTIIAITIPSLRHPLGQINEGDAALERTEVARSVTTF